MNTNLKKIEFRTCKDNVPAQDYEEVKKALGEIVSTVFPMKLGCYFDEEKGYAIYWEGQEEPIADEMTLEEFLNVQYVLCSAFGQWANETQHSNDEVIYLKEFEKESPQCHLKDRFGNPITRGMPVIYFEEDGRGNYVEFDSGTIIGFSNNFVKIEPNDRQKYCFTSGPMKNMPRIVYRKPNRLMIGIAGLPKLPAPPEKKEGEEDTKEVVEPENTNE